MKSGLGAKIMASAISMAALIPRSHSALGGMPSQSTQIYISDKHSHIATSLLLRHDLRLHGFFLSFTLEGDGDRVSGL